MGPRGEEVGSRKVSEPQTSDGSFAAVSTPIVAKTSFSLKAPQIHDIFSEVRNGYEMFSSTKTLVF